MSGAPHSSTGKGGNAKERYTRREDGSAAVADEAEEAHQARGRDAEDGDVLPVQSSTGKALL